MVELRQLTLAALAIAAPDAKEGRAFLNATYYKLPTPSL